ncbi:MAG: patatin-like phospholipase family protein [Gemmatimonadaceae bacterium]
MSINVSRHAKHKLIAGIRALLLASLASCATARTTELKTKYDLNTGYRFDKLALDTDTPARNSENLFVMLAFSGGGTRAAAMSYGVLSQLRAIKFHVDPATGEPVACAPAESAACKATERSLLDEVDVISSVSGGSFTSAYYALYGDSIFNRRSTFQENFLYHRLQSDLFKQLVYHPQNWKYALSRAEIAANYHADNVFGHATFAQLKQRPRPYLILNGTDASTGGRFEFTQEQFDLLCANLDSTPVARGVAASSAFPALLNSLTFDSFNSKSNCDYKPSAWETGGLSDATTNPMRYRRAQQNAGYRDPERKHLHVLDGGLADNLGLRSILLSLSSPDQPTQRINDDSSVFGGFSVMRRLANKTIKHVIVITVDARTFKPKEWDKKKSGPGLVSVVDASAGIPMGNFTGETLELMRRVVRDNSVGFRNATFHAAAITLDNDSLPPKEREYLNATGTNFELPAFSVNCLMSRSAHLLRTSGVLTANNELLTFQDFVGTVLKGSMAEAAVPSPETCTEDASKKIVKATSHTLDIALSGNMTTRSGTDVDFRRGAALSIRVAKPNGFGATAGFTWPEIVVPAIRDSTRYTLGRVRLYGLMGGVVLSRQLGPVEFSSGFSGGYALGNFRTSSSARALYARDGQSDTKVTASSSWLAKPNASVWYSLTEKYALTASASYLMTRPTLNFDKASGLPDRKLQVNAFQLSAGIGYRIF